jgi:uncharacterized membrane protein YcaP (DUF421 family)
MLLVNRGAGQMLETIYRTVLIYFFVLIVVRLMGKREIGQLSPFDFVVAIIIAELAAIPMESPGLPLWKALLPMATLAFLEVLLSYLALHSTTLRKILDGQPQLVIKNGYVLKEELRKARYNLNDLLAQLREKGIVHVGDVAYGILETSGKLSVIPRPQKRPVTPQDLGITTRPEILPAVLIMDGKIIKENLRLAGVKEDFLHKRLSQANLNPKDVFLAILDTDGKIFINKQKKKGKIARRKGYFSRW